MNLNIPCPWKEPSPLKIDKNFFLYALKDFLNQSSFSNEELNDFSSVFVR